MTNSERRLLVRSLSDEEYLDVMAVCAMFPHIKVEADMKGKILVSGRHEG